MTVIERLAMLRGMMAAFGIQAYYVPSNDYHGSEYIDDFFKCREFLTGFTGSAGDLVVLPGEAGLWTDGRYFLQAERELAGSGITLYRMGEEGVPTILEYLEQKLSSGQNLGFDGAVVETTFAQKMAEVAAKKGATITSEVDLLGDIWAERPPITMEPAYSLNVKYAGVSREDKILQVSEKLKESGADMLVLTALDDIAWLLNIRGEDIPYNQVVMSFFVLTPMERILFGRKNAFGEQLKQELTAAGVMLREYEMIFDYVSRVPEGTRISMDLDCVSYALFKMVPPGALIINQKNPTYLLKAVKNPTEIANERVAHIKDGVALVRFMYWLKQNVGKVALTEMQVSQVLGQCRDGVGNYMGPSFATIAGFGPNGAVVHYNATPETNAQLQPGQFLLLDSGGHYLEGTTDVTRTIFLGGEPTEEQKKYYTAVLKGHLALTAAKFKYGCTGISLDYLARAPLWDMGMDYNHGTGHGVGFLLNVHEGPNAFRYKVSSSPEENAVLEEGMITSVEPGVYLEGKFGIRLENLLLCVKREKTKCGQFMGFEPLTLVPFEREVIDVNALTARERQLLNWYHKLVFEKLIPYMTEPEKVWLQEVCSPL